MIKANCISNRLINTGEHLSSEFGGYFFPTDIDPDTKVFQVSKIVYHDLIKPGKGREPMDVKIDFILGPKMTWEPVEATYQLEEVGPQEVIGIDPHVAYALWISQMINDHIEKMEYLRAKGTKPQP